LLGTYLAAHPAPKVVVYTVFPANVEETASGNPEFRERFIRVYGTETKSSNSVPAITPATYPREGIRTLIGIQKGAPDVFFNTFRGPRAQAVHLDMAVP
jgi:hypothetical protein